VYGTPEALATPRAFSRLQQARPGSGRSVRAEKFVGRSLPVHALAATTAYADRNMRAKPGDSNARMIRPARLVPALLVLLALVLAFSHPGQVALKTLLLLPDMFPTSPVRPLTWLTGPPRLEEVAFDYPAGHLDADVYLPAEDGPHGALILLLG